MDNLGPQDKQETIKSGSKTKAGEAAVDLVNLEEVLDAAEAEEVAKAIPEEEEITESSA